MITLHNMTFHEGTVQVRHYDGTVETKSIFEDCTDGFPINRPSAGAYIQSSEGKSKENRSCRARSQETTEAWDEIERGYDFFRATEYGNGFE